MGWIMDGYNGWTNWDTWAANLWLTNDYGMYKAAVSIANNPSMTHTYKKINLMELLEEMGNPDNIDYDNVDWPEVIEALREE